ncbi:MAG: NAD(P)-binding protein, partial [Ruminococcaceae bacterium]|nr:NAD(P)-binding protein [Oscillospiraceae bacterium]
MHTEYLIIGGGISGLSFAAACDGDYLLIEKENEVGGYCRTIKRGDYVWDYAGHFFHFKDESLKKSFLDNMDNDRIVYSKKCTKILYKDCFVDYPFQANIHMLPQDDFIDCLYDLYFKEEKENYDSFLDMLYGKFGTSITEKFLRPYNEKLYACELSSLDRDAMGRFFPYADLTAIIKNMKNSELSSYNADFLYPRDGAGAFIDVLHKRLDPSRVLINTAVSKIFPEEKR